MERRVWVVLRRFIVWNVSIVPGQLYVGMVGYVGRVVSSALYIVMSFCRGRKAW